MKHTLLHHVLQVLAVVQGLGAPARGGGRPQAASARPLLVLQGAEPDEVAHMLGHDVTVVLRLSGEQLFELRNSGLVFIASCSRCILYHQMFLLLHVMRSLNCTYQNTYL